MNKRLVVLAMVVAMPVLADIPPSDTSGCANAQEGAACKTDDAVAGSCVTSTCSKNDYSGGVPPKQTTYACMKCVTSAAAPVPVVETKKKSGCAAVPAETLIGLAMLLGVRRKKISQS